MSRLLSKISNKKAVILFLILGIILLIPSVLSLPLCKYSNGNNFDGTWSYNDDGSGNDFSVTCRNGKLTSYCVTPALERGAHPGVYTCEGNSQTSCRYSSGNDFSGTWHYNDEGSANDFAVTCRNGKLAGWGLADFLPVRGASNVFLYESSNGIACKGVNGVSFDGTWHYNDAGTANDFAVVCKNGLLLGFCVQDYLPVRGANPGVYACSISIKCSNDNECNDNNAYTKDKCLNAGTTESSCTHTKITCINNNDCSTDGFVDSRCEGNSVFGNFKTNSCVNAGTTLSYCISSVENKFKLNCGESYCSNYGNYCKNGNVYKIRTCHDKGCSNGQCFDNKRTEEQLIQICDYGCSNGECVNIPQVCSTVYEPVCGVDGVTYSNECVMRTNNVSKAYDGECLTINCKKEGETIPVVPNAPQCCSGLALIPPKQKNIVGIMGICTAKCGNGVCDSDTETEYNCADDCYNGNNQIACSTDSECGVNVFVDKNFCKNDDVFGNLKKFQCVNPGRTDSYCTYSILSEFKTDCGETYCTNYTGNYCKNGNVYTSKICHDKGCSNGGCFDKINSYENLVQTCTNGCSNGVCKNNNTNSTSCSCDSDCGKSKLSYTCDGDDVIEVVKNPVCINNKCKTETEENFVKTCSKCQNGKCVSGFSGFSQVIPERKKQDIGGSDESETEAVSTLIGNGYMDGYVIGSLVNASSDSDGLIILVSEDSKIRINWIFWFIVLMAILIFVLLVLIFIRIFERV